MDYYSSAEGLTITHKRAIKELADHNFKSVEDIEEFYYFCGEKDSYNAQDVLAFLGY